MKTLLLLTVTLFFTVTISAQTRVVYGEVNVFKSMKLKNIMVHAKHAGTNAITDSLGNFFIVCNPKDVLIFDGETFKIKKVRVASKTDSIVVNLDFKETPNNVEMAIGYGYITKDKATYAFSNLNNKQEDFCSYSDIYSLIRGKCPGVSVMSTNNRPGADQEIVIRGISSISCSNTALYIIDGLEVSTLMSISPCDVKSISFLKDAAASIYGSRGGTGVVIIETIKYLGDF